MRRISIKTGWRTVLISIRLWRAWRMAGASEKGGGCEKGFIRTGGRAGSRSRITSRSRKRSRSTRTSRIRKSRIRKMQPIDDRSARAAHVAAVLIADRDQRGCVGGTPNGDWVVPAMGAAGADGFAIRAERAGERAAGVPDDQLAFLKTLPGVRGFWHENPYLSTPMRNRR